MRVPARIVYHQFVQDSRRWADFPFRADDIVVSTPSKCGTTWVQMICALLILQTPTLDRPLDRISPWLDMLTRPLDEVLADLDAQTHRRVVKTHTPLDGLPFDDRITYICAGRDPRDVALSWDNHRTNQVREVMARQVAAVVGPNGSAVGAHPATAATPYDRFWLWVDDTTPPQTSASTLAAMLHHIDTFWQERESANVLLLHYGDLKDDLSGQMQALARRLGIDVPEELWPDLVEAATLDRMREHADELAPSAADGHWRDSSRFFHRGTAGQWRELLDADDLRRYEARVAQLAAPDLVHWLHRTAEPHVSPMAAPRT